GARTEGEERGTAGASACQYPAGPYGLRVGDVIDPSLTWQGYAENATAPSTIRITDLFDCDGSRGIHALLIDNSTQWCEPCQEEAKDLGTKMKGQLGQDGVHALTLLIEDVNSNPASVKTAEEWRKAFALTLTDVV